MKKDCEVVSFEKIDDTTVKLILSNGKSLLIDKSDYENKGVFSIKLENRLVLRSDWADNIPPGM